MRMSLFLSLSLCCSALVACGGGNTDAGTGADAPATAAAPERRQAAGSACELFTSDEIKSAFGIAAGVELRVKETRSAFPACSYEWGEDLVVRTLKVANQEIEVREPATAMLVVAEGVNPGGFETSTSVYKDAEDVPGIGDMARWGTAMSQLSVLHGSTLYHVNVKASSSPEENRALALALGRRLVARG